MDILIVLGFCLIIFLISFGILSLVFLIAKKPIPFKSLKFILFVMLMSGFLALIFESYFLNTGGQKSYRQDAVIASGMGQFSVVASFIKNDNDSYAQLCDSQGKLNIEIEKISGESNSKEWLLQHYNRIINNNGGVEPICYADKENFCISSPLSGGGTHCRDNNSGNYGEEFSQGNNCSANNIACE